MSHAAWLRQAESDLAAAEVLSSAGCHSQAVWFASQSIENAHKAILAALGMRYEERHFKYLGHKTSEIAALLPASLHEPLDPEIAKLNTLLETRGGNSRYPAPAQKAGQPTALAAPADWITTSQKDIEDAKRLLGWCRERVNRAVKAAAVMKPT